MKKTQKRPSRPVKPAASHAHMRRAGSTQAGAAENPYVIVRQSKIHGRGVYAARRIRKSTRIIEYVGDRIAHEVADARYDAKTEDDGHTFLFVVDDDLCIDAGVGGNAARFINHKCEANCETVIQNRRVFIEATRTIQPGEELGYDYQLTWESTDDPNELKLYACRCGAAKCRGTMLDRESLDVKRRKERARKKARKAAAGKAAVGKAGASARKAAGKAAGKGGTTGARRGKAAAKSGRAAPPRAQR
ncbi:MAG: SET domain-containing protein, partial [Steroidobacteraceae bacterium]